MLINLKSENQVTNYLNMAQDIEKARKKIDQYVLVRHLNSQSYQTWSESCSEFKNLLSKYHNNHQLYPDEIKLKQGDLASIQIAINYLAADPFYFSSGYKKELLTKLLKQLAATKNEIFSDKQLEQLNLILLQKVQSGYSREFRYYCRLARVFSSPTLIEQLNNLSCSDDVTIRLQAYWMLDYLNL